MKSYTAAKANQAISRHPEVSGDVFKSMLVGQAITQTSTIYGLLIAFVLIFKGFPQTNAIARLASGLCMGIGGIIGPGIGEGITTIGTVKWVARNEKSIGELTRTMLVGMAVAESTGIYSLVVALVLLFVV